MEGGRKGKREGGRRRGKGKGKGEERKEGKEEKFFFSPRGDLSNFFLILYFILLFFRVNSYCLNFVI